MERALNWLNKSLIRPLQLMTWRQRGMAIIVGLVGGLFPVPMVTSLVCAIVCLFLRLSAPQAAVATVMNLLLTPLQIILIPGFASLAAFVTGADASDFTLTAIYHAKEGGLLAVLTSATSLLLHAVGSWLVLSAFAVTVAHNLLAEKERPLKLSSA